MEQLVVEKGRQELQVIPSQATSLLQAITNAASNKDVDIEKMERLFAMHREMVAREAEMEFNRALALAQKKILPVAAKAYNSHTQSRYAKLEEINEMLLPVYTAEGFSLSFNTEAMPEKGWIRTVAILSHRAGHTRTYNLDLPLDDSGVKGTSNKTGVQATGSSTAYARRYLTRMIFNVSTFDDNDGNGKKSGPTPDAAGKAALESCGSIDALKKAWAGLTGEQRNTLGEVMTECRRKIREADAA